MEIMPIPECDLDGFLPPGVHFCTLDELKDRFGRFQGSDRRPMLFERFAELIAQLRRSSLFIGIVVDGSFTTAEPRPNDIDVVLVLRGDHDSTAQLPMSDYALVDRRSAQRRFGFDVLIAREGSLEYDEYVGFFAQVRSDRQKSKGMLRIGL